MDYVDEDLELTDEEIKRLAAVFTPKELVNEILDKLDPEIWKESGKTWLDPTCGDGAFLVEVKERLLKYHELEHVLTNMLFGADIEKKNVKACICRLYGINENDLTEIDATTEGGQNYLKSKGYKGLRGLMSVFEYKGELIRNFVVADGLEYEYNFGREIDETPNFWEL